MPGGKGEQPLVIGLTGPLGSGVTTTSKVLEKKDFHRISMSEVIRDEYRRRRQLSPGEPIPRSPDLRKELQDLGNEMRSSQGLSHWIEKAVEPIAPDQPIVIDGIRNTGEVDWLRRTYPRFFLVAVVAPERSRWERVRKVYQGRQLEFERDDKRNTDEDIPHGQQVQKCVLDSDFVFTNEDTQHNLPELWEGSVWSKLGAAVQLMRGERGRGPTTEEVFMAMAYAQSHASACLKRHVGAVIVDTNRQSLSSGYNENPLEMLPCKHQFNYCYKDKDMEE